MAVVTVYLKIRKEKQNISVKGGVRDATSGQKDNSAMVG